MYLLLVILVGAELSAAAESSQDTSAYNNNVAKKVKNPKQGALGFYASLTNNPLPVNKTYFEKDENQLRLPKNIYDDPKKKRKIKKSPKRTIQKIIKKGKNRSRKIYVNPATRLPTISPNKKIQETNERYTSKNEEVTTEVNQRKKPRKNTKFSRNPKPFQKFQKKDNHNRYKRQIERDNVYILKDLDELKFLSKEKDYDIIQTHVQKYW